MDVNDPARHPSMILPLHSFDMTRVDDVLDEASDLNAQQLYACARFLHLTVFILYSPVCVYFELYATRTVHVHVHM